MTEKFDSTDLQAWAEDLGIPSFLPEPRPTEEGWQTNQVDPKDNPEDIVPVGMFARGKFGGLYAVSAYAGLSKYSPHEPGEYPSALSGVYLRPEFAQDLVESQENSEGQYGLVIFDGLRLKKLQLELFEALLRELRDKRRSRKWSAEELVAEAVQYVSIPSDDPSKPAPHQTGGAADLAIVRYLPAVAGQLSTIRLMLLNLETNDTLHNDLDEALDENSLRSNPNPFAVTEYTSPRICEWVAFHVAQADLLAHGAVMLDFGTPFDSAVPESAAYYYHDKSGRLTRREKRARDNRDTLFEMIENAGVPFTSEWWHINAKRTQMHAAVTGQTVASYGAAVLNAANQAHERAIATYHREEPHRNTVLARAADILSIR